MHDAIQPARRNLVFARVGRGSLHNKWAGPAPKDRSWDIQLSTYLDDISAFTEGDFPVYIDKGTKWDSIVRYFQKNPELLDRYDHIFFPDDDLDMVAAGVETIFAICGKYDLYIAQPALTPKSYYWHPILLRCAPFQIRYINYVEPMGPCIKSSYLRDIMPVIEKNFTGWGIDNIWTQLMDEPVGKAAIIDSVAVTHTRPFETGAIYDAFKEMKIDPHQQRRNILKDFQAGIVGMVVYGGVLKTGWRVNGIAARIISGLYMLSTIPFVRNKQGSVRVAIGSFVRAFTLAKYRPQHITVPNLEKPVEA
ncbi:MAG: DUF707 domain-containing protein [Acidobacteriaceae bacterium]|jgi:hypothetical protein|nr:DUF707 domain-containing protein [Acidobacteriaceae bacterium]